MMNEKQKYHVDFRLFPDRLEMRHNGIPFADNDVEKVCGILEEKQDTDIRQIGKFGIGFKSVYAYTASPEVHSEEKSFQIRDYVLPYPLEGGQDLQVFRKIREDISANARMRALINKLAQRLLAIMYSDKTHFVYELLQNAEDACERKNRVPDLVFKDTLLIIRFNNPSVSSEKAYDEIKDRLENLGLRTMLFLNNIEEISYEVGSIKGRFAKESKVEGGMKQVTLSHIENGKQRSSEKWLMFERQSSADAKRKIEVAYQLVYDNASKDWRIRPVKNSTLFVYFPTQKETHLSFLIQGPYNTTPARDNIKLNDEFNERLIAETADLVADSLLKIKTWNLLDVGFLNTLPLDTDFFTSRESLFGPVYEKVKEVLSSDEPLLPAYGGDFVKTAQALIARGEELRKLVAGDQLGVLFNVRGSRWIDSNITQDRTPELWKYLTEVLMIDVVDPESFARSIDEDFLERQTDEWMIAFYDFLNYQKALWRESMHSWERPGVIRSKPIIRLGDNSHTAPFDVSGKPNAYLPSKDPAIGKHFVAIVKDAIAKDKKARDFLKALGIDEPDAVAIIMELVLPSYAGDIQVPDADNLHHVELILRALDGCSDNKKKSLINELKNTRFLKAINASTGEKRYQEPAQIHLGEKYSGIRRLEVYFAGNDEVWFLDDQYLTIDSIKESGSIGKLKELGCGSEISVKCGKPDYLDYVTVADSHSNHSRGLKGFDPYCEIEELEYVLEHISVEKAKILWPIVKEFRRAICGEVETSSRQNYEDATRHFQYSKMGKLLVEKAWLPDSSSNFHKPSEMTLSALLEDFDRESPEAKSLAEKLGVITEPHQELQRLFDRTPEDVRQFLSQARPLLEIFMSAAPEQQQQILDSAREILTSEKEKSQELTGAEPAAIAVHPSPLELWEEFSSALEKERPEGESVEPSSWTGPTPEEEEEIQRNKFETLSRMSKEPQTLKRIRREVTSTRSEDKGDAVLKAFLLEEYRGHCQICNAKLDLGGDKPPWFDTYRLDEKRNLHGEWSNQEYNGICLCPNCHALMKHGGRDLKNVIEKAKNIAAKEEAPEEVGERNGDFYRCNVNVAGKPREIFYTPVHMASLVAFLKFARKA